MTFGDEDRIRKLWLSGPSSVHTLLHNLSSYKVPETVFLCCEFGWSIYIDTSGNRDPTQFKPDWIHIREGVPTNERTMECKMFLCNNGSTASNPISTSSSDDSQPIRGREHVPRSLATASWTKFWSTGSETFEHSMYDSMTPRQRMA